MATAGRVRAEIDGGPQLFAKIRAINEKTKKDFQKRVEIGYSAYYAIYVHEDLSMNHPNGGEAKFLEKAIRKISKMGELGRIVKRKLEQGLTIGEALLAVGLRIIEVSNEIVPVDTGFLRDSAFVNVKG